MSRFQIILLAFALGLVAALPLRGQDNPLGPQHGVILLRNGEIEEGEILLSGDSYDVDVGGGQIHVKRERVEFVGRTLRDCYEHRRSRVEPSKVQDHLELAEWCLRHRLLEQAALALANAVDADSNHPKIALLETRLKFAIARPPEKQGKSTPPADDAPQMRDLERLVGGLPPGCVETFTTSIQLILDKHCSTAGCHGPRSSTPLKLLRISANSSPSRSVTQRNLYSVLSTIDYDHPSESPLLTAPTHPHGNVKSALFSPREAVQYQRLVAWVHQVTERPLPGGLGTADLNSSSGRRSLRRTMTQPKEPQSTSEATTDKASVPATVKLSKSTDKTEQQTASTDDVDQFDPDVFNRRYSKAEEKD